MADRRVTWDNNAHKALCTGPGPEQAPFQHWRVPEHLAWWHTECPRLTHGKHESLSGLLITFFMKLNNPLILPGPFDLVALPVPTFQAHSLN